MAPELQHSPESRTATTGFLPSTALRPGEGAAWWRRLWQRVRQSFTEPLDPAQCRTTIERLVALEIPALLLLLAHDYAQQRTESIVPLSVQEAVLLLALLLNRWGRSVVATHLFCFGNWAMVTALLLVSREGLSHAAMLGLPAVLLGTGLFLNLRLLFSMALLVSLTIVGLAAAAAQHWLPALRTAVGYAEMWDLLVVLGFTVAAIVLYSHDIVAALRSAQEQGRRLGASTSELERQAEVLKGTSRKLQMAMELAVVGLVHADADGRITEANSRAGALIGCTREELIGRSFMEFFAADELQRHPPRWDALENGQAFSAERELTRGDGTRILVEMTTQRLPDRTIQCFVRDITGLRAQEEASRQRQRLESLGTLAGGVAHDFNNLLTVMHGAADTLALQEGAAGAAGQPLHDLRTAIEQANGLTRQLLAFARKQTLDRRSLDLRQVLERNARMLRRLIGPQIELVVDGGETACPVLADEGALAQVFTNLAVNARDAMPKGGRLTYACSAQEVRTGGQPNATARPGRYVLVRVSDTGEGMREEVRRQIFEPFFTTKGKEQGTGLGLSVSLGIVEQHGGWIEVVSEVGRGTEFRVFLPWQTSPPVAGQAAAVAPPPVVDVRGSETILLVEDEEPVRRLAAGALALCGFKVIEAVTGAEALKRWPEIEAQVQLLLTDVAMPGGVNGVDLAQACRATRPTLPILITSGYNQETISFSAGQWDDIRFLPKPYTMASITRMAREAIDTPVVPKTG